MKVIKISFTLIRAIKVADLYNVLKLMSAAIFGNPNTFKGVQPFTADELKTLGVTFTEAQSAFLMGGLNQKQAYMTAWEAITNALISFGGYVNGIAKGDLEILHLSTLPTTEETIDYLAELKAGQHAVGIKGTPGFRGQLLLECGYFAPNAEYIMILSAETPLADNVKIDHAGNLSIPGGNVNDIIIAMDESRKKNIVGLTPGKNYYTHFALKYGKYVGLLSTGVEVSCGH